MVQNPQMFFVIQKHSIESSRKFQTTLQATRRLEASVADDFEMFVENGVKILVLPTLFNNCTAELLYEGQC